MKHPSIVRARMLLEQIDEGEARRAYRCPEASQRAQDFIDEHQRRRAEERAGEDERQRSNEGTEQQRTPRKWPGTMVTK